MTTERRDIAGEHITVDEQAAIVKQYKLDPKRLAIIIREQATVNIWKEIERMKHECLICGQIVEGRQRYAGSRRTNTNFGRTSHGQKHINDGTALSVWGGADGIRIMPSKKDIISYIEQKIAQTEIDKVLPELRKARKPYIDLRKRALGNREGLERELVRVVRKNGLRALSYKSIMNIAVEIEAVTREIDEHSKNIDEIESGYPAAVLGQLTFGDL